MSIDLLMNRPCVINRRGGEVTDDEYGNEDTTVETVETVCELQQQRREEETRRGTIETTTWVLFLPTGTAIDTGDQVTVDDVAFEVAGDPWMVRNPRTQTNHHIEATLRRTGGEAGPV